MKTTVSSKGQIVLPAELRKQDRIRPGHRFQIRRLKAGRYLLTQETESANEGLVDLLLACPVKGWFVPIPTAPTDTTDNL